MKTKILFAHSAGLQYGKGQGSFDLVNYLHNAVGDCCDIIFPVVKDPDAPAYQNWKSLLDIELNKLEEPILLVGHSLGGSVLLKYLSEEKLNLQIKGMFLIATPQWSEDGWDMKEFAFQREAVAGLIPESRLYFYHCMADPIVPFEHLSFYKNVFPNAIFSVLNCNDHMFSDGLKELADDIHLMLADNQ